MVKTFPFFATAGQIMVGFKLNVNISPSTQTQPSGSDPFKHTSGREASVRGK